MKINSLTGIFAIFLALTLQARETEICYLSGRGCDNTVQWDFYCTAGRGSGVWTKIQVPSNWELQGFGQYTYGHMPLHDRLGESGIYRHIFSVPVSWKGSRVEIVFGGAMTDTQVSINGRFAGPVHQGGYYEFRYDISKLLKYGKANTLEVRVDKLSSDESVVKAESLADFWTFGGIFRPVWLECKPATCISEVAVDAKADGSILVEATVAGKTRGCRLSAQVRTLEGEPCGPIFEHPCGDAAVTTLSSMIEGIQSWSAEFPRLYKLELYLSRGGELLHRVSEKIGFRTIELRPSDGIYLNGVKIWFKGVDRHSFWPESGRTLSDAINLSDALLVKEMNMNAVRCSHYPPDRAFLDYCDSLGIYVIDELTGWQDAYGTVVGKELVRELVVRDRNHPSVLLWANGNEGGFNYELVDDYSRLDPQNRQVIHPWLEDELVNTFHYPSWSSMREYLAKGRKVWFPTEFNHGLYDGGHGAGLEDYWNIMKNSPLCAGGFLWDFSDQGVVRTDRGGELDTDGNHGADGILGPYRQKEGSFYAIRDIWCPVQIEGPRFLPSSFDGTLRVDNEYSFTSLEQCNFSAVLKRFSFPEGVNAETAVSLIVPDIAPGMSGEMKLVLPADFGSYDMLELKMTDAAGRHSSTWTWTVGSAESFAAKMIAADSSKGGRLPLSNIRMVERCGKNAVLDIKELPSGWTQVQWDLDYRGLADNAGITFDFPEKDVVAVRWLGDGPYRVWRNRTRGVAFGLWEKAYNDTATGESWEYPEFKGYHSNMYVADIVTRDGILCIVFGSNDLYLRLFTPSKQLQRNNDNTLGAFPDGQISVLNAISAVGTKFKRASETGPDGEKAYLEHNASRHASSASGICFMKFIPTSTVTDE
ncbi:MAG: glycoside hydrolase family 2 [Bacteroidales bacterium]|nr:glycoside hydrolase family 2 [Bacteroidales bacterium]